MDLAKLAVPFPPEDLEWRLQRVGGDDNKLWALAVAYVTNRAIMERLDDVCGPENWRNEYKEWTTGTPGVLCGISIKVGDEWITKWDGAEQTKVEAVKGGLSASMKRAAVQWGGIGRYLYKLEENFVKIHSEGQFRAFNVKAKMRGAETPTLVTFRWDPPDLPPWALPPGYVVKQKPVGYQAPYFTPSANSGPPQRAAAPSPQAPVAAGAPVQPSPRATTSLNAPSEKQRAFYLRLADSPCFTAEERRLFDKWLTEKATRQTIKDQIDWLKQQVLTRKAPEPAQRTEQPFDEMPSALTQPEEKYPWEVAS